MIFNDARLLWVPEFRRPPPVESLEDVWPLVGVLSRRATVSPVLGNETLAELLSPHPRRRCKIDCVEAGTYGEGGCGVLGVRGKLEAGSCRCLSCTGDVLLPLAANCTVRRLNRLADDAFSSVLDLGPYIQGRAER